MLGNLLFSSEALGHSSVARRAQRIPLMSKGRLAILDRVKGD
jgi:hypothetical protein